jgi:hypothetical protein
LELLTIRIPTTRYVLLRGRSNSKKVSYKKCYLSRINYMIYLENYQFRWDAWWKLGDTFKFDPSCGR